MLPKSIRLNLRREFKWVISGKKSEGDLVKLFSRFGNSQPARIGIATSAKVFKRAVDRNRARRITSRAFEMIYNYLIDGVNIVALPKAKVLETKVDELSQELKKLLQENKLLR